MKDNMSNTFEKERVNIFVSYSHNNMEWLDSNSEYGFIPWLSSQLHEIARFWTDHALKRLPGEEYRKVITSEIKKANIAILILSPDFLASEFIQKYELPEILKRYENNQIRIIPIYANTIGEYSKTKVPKLFDLQLIPGFDKSLSSYTQDRYSWEKAKEEIKDAVFFKIEDLKKRETTNHPEKREVITKSINDQLFKLSKKNKKEFLENNSQKYDPVSYILRESFQKFYSEYYNNPIVILLGEAGMGKTNETCNLISTKLENEICFAFNSQSFDQPIENYLCQHFTQIDFNLYNKDLKSILNKIDSISQSLQIKTYFIFDAINEATSYPIKDNRLKGFPMLQLMKDIKEYLLDENYHNLNVIISCRSSQYEHLKTRIGFELKLNIDAVPAFTLEKYSNSELKQIFAIYQKEYSLQTTINEFNEPGFREIRTSLTSPLFFKLFVKLYRDKKLPVHIINYDFVEVVRKLLSENLYESNFHAYELLLRITQWLRINYKDSIDMNLIVYNNDSELHAIKEKLITPEGKISPLFDILFSENYLKYENGQIRFVYEKMQEALYEISFLNEHNNDIIECSAYKEILNKNPKYDVIYFSYLSNACISNYENTNNLDTINDIIVCDNDNMQILAQLVLIKLFHKGYTNIAHGLLEKMISSGTPIAIESALKSISILFDQYESSSDYENAQKKESTPIKFFLSLFNSSPNDEILNKAGLQLYNITLQHQHLSGVIMNELFNSLLNTHNININTLMQVGLLSCVISIDTLVNKNQLIKIRKDFVEQNILIQWKSIAEKIFHSTSNIFHPNYPKTSNLVSKIPGFLRNTLLGIGIRVAMMKYFTIQTDYTNNLKEYDNYWKNIPLKRKNQNWSKEKFCEIADLYDVNTPLNQKHTIAIIEAFKTGDVFSYLMLERMLICRGIENWNEVREILKKALDLNESDTNYADYLQMSQCYILFHIIDKSKNNIWTEAIEGEAFKLLEQIAYNWSKRTYGRFKTPYIDNVKTTYGVYKQFVLNWYIVAACKMNNSDEYSVKHIPMITKQIDELFEKAHIDKDLLLYILENIAIAATNLGKINTSLALFEYLVKNLKDEKLLKNLAGNGTVVTKEYKDKTVEEYFISILNTMKAFFPNQTAKFEAENLTILAEDNNYLANLIIKKSQVISKTEETLASLLTSRFGNLFVWGLCDEDIRKFIVHTLKASEKRKNSKDWALYCFQHTFKVLLGYKI